MDPMSLIERATGAGLVLTAAGDRLNVTGPKTPASVAIVKELAAHKVSVLAWLAIETPIEIAPDITAQVRAGDASAHTERLRLPRALWQSGIADYSEAWRIWQALRQDYFAAMGKHETGWYINDTITQGYIEAVTV